MPIRPFACGIYLLSGMAAQGQWTLHPISATVLPHNDGIRVALLVDLYIGCPEFSHVLYQENDTMRLQACYYTTIAGNMAGCWRYDTVDVSSSQLNGCELVVDFNEIGTFYTLAIDTLLIETQGPFDICSVGVNQMDRDPFRAGPNPFLDHLIIYTDVAANYTVEFFHPSGRSVFRDHRPFNKGSNVVYLSDMASGLYLMRIDGSGRSWYRTVVKP